VYVTNACLSRLSLHGCSPSRLARSSGVTRTPINQHDTRYLGRLSNFGQKYGIDLFPKAPITQPPRLAVIPLLWGIFEYTLQTPQKTGEGIKCNTARSLQSAASAYHLWEKMPQFPGHMYRDRDNNVFGASHLSPTDSDIATLGNKVMRRRLGTDSRPPSFPQVHPC
jgi:hypothetical protein